MTNDKGIRFYKHEASGEVVRAIKHDGSIRAEKAMIDWTDGEGVPIQTGDYLIKNKEGFKVVSAHKMKRYYVRIFGKQEQLEL